MVTRKLLVLGMTVLCSCATGFPHNRSFESGDDRHIASVAQESLPIIQLKTPYESSFIFAPNDHQRHPAIVLLHGSEGGSLRNMWVHALLLAEQGFAVMNLCWWDCGRDVRAEPMPMMTDIEVTETIKAIDWFQKSQDSEGSVAVYGISKGAELAMILVANPDQLPFKIQALALHSPNDVVEAGSNINWLDKRCWICPKGVRDCSYQRQYWNRSCGALGGTYKPEHFDTLPMWRWNGEMLKLGSRIKLENYSGPVLITAGDKDTDWKSDKDRVQRILQAMDRAGRKTEAHVFQNEEHSFSLEAEQKRKALVNLFFKRHLN